MKVEITLIVLVLLAASGTAALYFGVPNLDGSSNESSSKFMDVMVANTDLPKGWQIHDSNVYVMLMTKQEFEELGYEYSEQPRIVVGRVLSKNLRQGRAFMEGDFFADESEVPEEIELRNRDVRQRREDWELILRQIRKSPIRKDPNLDAEMDSVLVAARDLQPDDVILPEDLIYVPLAAGDDYTMIPRDPAELIGRTVRIPIAAGEEVANYQLMLFGAETYPGNTMKQLNERTNAPR